MPDYQGPGAWNVNNEADLEEVASLEDAGEEDTAAAIRVFILMASPKAESPDTTEDTATTVFFELLFHFVSPFGLLANLASLISLADRWRMRAHSSSNKEQTIQDVSWVMALNAVALGIGCFANVILFMHAELWFRRRISMLITCTCYLLAVCIYMGLLGAAEYRYFQRGSGNVHRTLGYWQAVCASVLYFVATLLLLLHMWYFRHRKWDKALSERQRQLMILCILYVFWIAIGAASFQASTMLDTNFAEATYFVVVSYLTLGYGDLVPSTNLGRALDLPFLYTGIIVGGLVSIAIFQASLRSAHSRAVITGIQRDKQALLQKWTADNGDVGDGSNAVSMQAGSANPASNLDSGALAANPDTLKVAPPSSDSSSDGVRSPTKKNSCRTAHTEEEGFNEIRRIVTYWQRRQVIWQLSLVLIWLVVFWLIGALIFSYTEGWEYFIAFYMCGTSLSSVGYGDFVPTSPGGRSVFIHWAIMALPTMSAAVSGISSAVMKPLGEKKLLRKFENYFKRRGRQHEDEASGRQTYINKWFSHRRIAQFLPDYVTADMVREVAESNDNTAFSFKIWHNIVRALHGGSELPTNYWISDSSPLSVPGLNEKHALTLMIVHQITPQQLTPSVQNNTDTSASS